MEKLFNPGDVAVVGVSRHKNKVGRIIFDNLIGKVKVYPVNPHAKRIEGHKVYKSVLDIEGPVDLAVVAVPSPVVPSVMEEIGKKRIPYAVIISAGFSESGDKSLARKVFEIANKYGVRLVGPNSMGIITNGLNITFTNFKIKKGKMAFISQSGALGTGVLDKLTNLNVGLSKFISVGNQLDLCISDFISFLDRDDNTKVIFVYVEGLKDGNKFFEACKKAHTPIIVLKGGKSKKGSKAAKSHTASMSTDISIWKGVLNQLKIPMVNSVGDLINSALAIERFGKIGRRGVVVTNAGGLGVLISDAIGDLLVDLDDVTLNALNGILPPHWSKGNPIDIIGDADSKRYEKVIDYLISTGKFDFIVVGFTPQAMSEPVKTAKKLLKFNFPIFPLFLGGVEVEMAQDILKKKFVVINDVNELSFLRNIIK